MNQPTDAHPEGLVVPSETHPASRLTVCIVTYERPAFLLRCLASLGEADSHGAQIVVIDSSRESAESVVSDLTPGTAYRHAPQLAGWMTRSRNEALLYAAGDIVSFLDDDVVVQPGWDTALLLAFQDQSVGAVVGRTQNGIPGEESYDPPVGRVNPDGSLTDGFASVAQHITDVDHGIGANMAFRRSVLRQLGGFRDDYPGTALREDTDMFLRIGAVGARAVFVPDACVDHLPAPHVRGARFDTRYKLYGRRNHMVLLARAYGIRAPILRRWVRAQYAAVAAVPGVRRKLERIAVTSLGVLWGTGAMLKNARWAPMSPSRTGDAADRVRAALASNE